MLDKLIFAPVEWLARCAFSISSRRLLRRLQQTGRVLSIAAVRERLHHGQGALILEAPMRGYLFHRIWWTDQEEKFLPRPDRWSEEDIYPAEDAVNFQAFLSEQSGCAFLLPIWFTSEQIDSFLKEQFGANSSSDCHFIWSAWLLPEQARES